MARAAQSVEEFSRKTASGRLRTLIGRALIVAWALVLGLGAQMSGDDKEPPDNTADVSELRVISHVTDRRRGDNYSTSPPVSYYGVRAYNWGGSPVNHAKVKWEVTHSVVSGSTTEYVPVSTSESTTYTYLSSVYTMRGPDRIPYDGVAWLKQNFPYAFAHYYRVSAKVEGLGKKYTGTWAINDNEQSQMTVGSHQLDINTGEEIQGDGMHHPLWPDKDLDTARNQGDITTHNM